MPENAFYIYHSFSETRFRKVDLVLEWCVNKPMWPRIDMGSLRFQ